MASPPPKRQRRTVVVISEDESSATESQLSTASLNVTTRSLSLKKDPRPQSKPRKQATSPKSKAAPNNKAGKAKSSNKSATAITKNATIYSFFNNATQGSSSQPTVKRRSPSRETPVVASDDLVEDISSGDEDTAASQRTVRPQIIRTSSFTTKGNTGTPEPSAITRSKQFSNTTNNSDNKLTDISHTSSITGSWADLYPPESLDELVVHKRKVSDVHKWLDNVTKGRERMRLLVLKGPSGSGKTATLKLLAKEIGVKVVEWENPIGSAFDDEIFVSLATQFDEFLTRTINFHGLQLEDTQSRDSISIMDSEPSQKLVLIEDFPNTFARGSSVLMNFRDSVLRYLAASVPSLGSRAANTNITPVVMIVTETHLTSSLDYSDSFTVGKLLGPQILQHPGVTVIEFNPVATTLLTKALTTVIRKDNKAHAKKWSPNADLIKKISQSGDIRSSINSLQLTYLFEQGQGNLTDGSQSLSKKTSKKRPLKSTDEEKPPVDFRDDIIDLFHAVGKILYNKRIELSNGLIVQPPSHLQHHFRLRPSEVSIESLHADIGSDIATFISTLHENYPLSCYGEDFADSLDDCIAHLSDSDLLLSLGNDTTSARTLGKLPSTQIQLEYAFQTASRGLLFSLPYPVERGKTMSSVLKLGRDPFRMVYPTALKLWRQTEENESLIDEWNDYTLRDTYATDVCRRISRLEMVTEYLPYISKIRSDLVMARTKKNFGSAAKTTMPAEGDDDFDTPAAPLASVLELPVPPPADAQGSRATDKKKDAVRFGGQAIVPAKDVSLVLSDDDIEDD